jgi:predicted proteasome-type protease
MTTISTDSISATDLSLVVITQGELAVEETIVQLTNEDRKWQEERRQRKVKRLDFEVR